MIVVPGGSYFSFLYEGLLHGRFVTDGQLETGYAFEAGSFG